jgi:hypothetical protein
MMLTTPELNNSSDIALYGMANILPDKNFANTFLHLHTESYLGVHKP